MQFEQARNYRRGRRQKIQYVVIHTAECGETPTAAEGVASYFAGPGAPVASAHYTVDENSVVQSVREADTAYAAPPLNDAGLHIEHAGRASQPREQWLDASSIAILTNSAKLTAQLALKHGIEVKHLSDGELASRRGTGFVGHVQVSHIWHQSDHTDPGDGFPWDIYIGMVRAEAAAWQRKPYTRSRIVALAAACGVALSVFAGVSQTDSPVTPATPTTTTTTQPAPRPRPAPRPHPAPAPKPKRPAPKPPAPEWDGHSWPGVRAFRLGHTHPAVTVLGKRLVAHGYGRHYASGPGPTFTRADLLNVRDFQRAQGWRGRDADGYPGPETWKRLAASTRVTVTVRWGDCLSTLAVRYGTTVGRLRALNHVNARGVIYAGQRLRIR